MKTKIVVDVHTRRRVSAEEVAESIGALIDIGLADAAETLELDEGDLEDAQLAVDLNIGKPVPADSRSAPAGVDLKAQTKALHAALKDMGHEVSYSKLLQAASRASEGITHQAVKARKAKAEKIEGGRRFVIELDEAGGQTGRMLGELSARGDVSFGRVVWKDEDATQETVGVCLWFDANGKQIVTLTGDAWRNLEDASQLHLFIRLAAVSMDAAQEAADLLDQDTEPTIYATLVTRDAGTESCTVHTRDVHEDNILEAAEYIDESAWTLDEGNPKDDAYLCGDVEEVAEEISVKDYLKALLASALEEQQKSRTEKAFELLEEVAKMDLPTSKECKAALQRFISKAQALLA